MQNFIQPGDTVTLTAPSGGVVSGTGYLIGSLFVVACHSADAGASFEGQVSGVFTLPKADSQAWTEGQKIYWNDLAAGSGGQVCTNVATAGQLIGVATAAVAVTGGLVTGRVRLNGIAPATAEGPQATIAALTFGTAVAAATANGVLVDSASTNPSDAQFNETSKELGTKINDIIAALKAAGIIAAS